MNGLRREMMPNARISLEELFTRMSRVMEEAVEDCSSLEVSLSLAFNKMNSSEMVREFENAQDLDRLRQVIGDLAKVAKIAAIQTDGLWLEADSVSNAVTLGTVRSALLGIKTDPSGSTDEYGVCWL